MPANQVDAPSYRQAITMLIDEGLFAQMCDVLRRRSWFRASFILAFGFVLSWVLWRFPLPPKLAPPPAYYWVAPGALALALAIPVVLVGRVAASRLWVALLNAEVSFAKVTGDRYALHDRAGYIYRLDTSGIQIGSRFPYIWTRPPDGFLPVAHHRDEAARLKRASASPWQRAAVAEPEAMLHYERLVKQRNLLVHGAHHHD